MNIASLNLLEGNKIDRVLIIDFDAHRGKGTENLVRKNKQVAQLSTEVGFLGSKITKTERSERILLGPIINEKSYLGMFKKRTEKFAKEFEPDLIGVCAGFDLHKHWKNRMLSPQFGGLTDASYKKIGEHLNQLAKKHTDGCIFSILEGGYHPSLHETIDAYISGFE